MSKLKLYLLAFVCLFANSMRADEGMWLLQMMEEQHLIDIMREKGLNLESEDLYNPNGLALKDAVGIFAGAVLERLFQKRD